MVSCGPGETPLESLPTFGDDLPRLCALLQQATVVVGSSTGPVHLAAALGTSTLAIHAPWSSCGPVRWGPYSGAGWSLVADVADAADGAVRWDRATRQRQGGELLAAVDAASVASCVLALAGGRRPELQISGV